MDSLTLCGDFLILQGVDSRHFYSHISPSEDGANLRDGPLSAKIYQEYRAGAGKTTWSRSQRVQIHELR